MVKAKQMVKAKRKKVDQQAIEREFFRMLNRIVEPAVRAGVGSPRFVPGGLIVLESIGHKTGQPRRTPLVAIRVQGHVLISTARGDRSFWVKNLAGQPRVQYWLAGRSRQARAFVMFAGKRFRVPKSLPPALQSITRFLAPYTRAGWAFAVLSPVPSAKAKTPKC